MARPPIVTTSPSGTRCSIRDQFVPSKDDILSFIETRLEKQTAHWAGVTPQNYPLLNVQVQVQVRVFPEFESVDFSGARRWRWYDSLSEMQERQTAAAVQLIASSYSLRFKDRMKTRLAGMSPAGGADEVWKPIAQALMRVLVPAGAPLASLRVYGETYIVGSAFEHSGPGISQFWAFGAAYWNPCIGRVPETDGGSDRHLLWRTLHGPGMVGELMNLAAPNSLSGSFVFPMNWTNTLSFDTPSGELASVNEIFGGSPYGACQQLFGLLASGFDDVETILHRISSKFWGEVAKAILALVLPVTAVPTNLRGSAGSVAKVLAVTRAANAIAPILFLIAVTGVIIFSAIVGRKLHDIVRAIDDMSLISDFASDVKLANEAIALVLAGLSDSAYGAPYNRDRGEEFLREMFVGMHRDQIKQLISALSPNGAPPGTHDLRDDLARRPDRLIPWNSSPGMTPIYLLRSKEYAFAFGGYAPVPASADYRSQDWLSQYSSALQFSATLQLAETTFALAIDADGAWPFLVNTLQCGGVVSVRTSASAQDLTALQEILGGLSLSKMIAFLWRQGIADNFLAWCTGRRLSRSISCLRETFCWMTTQADRDVLDRVLGPISAEPDEAGLYWRSGGGLFDQLLGAGIDEEISVRGLAERWINLVGARQRISVHTDWWRFIELVKMPCYGPASPLYVLAAPT